MAKLTLKSYAKLNLYLAVVNKRCDQYHNIESIFERISLCDTIILKTRKDTAIKIVTDTKELPCDQSNLALRSALLLQEYAKVNKGVDIVLKKRIPLGSGMGGGSSNAAFVLCGLNKIWKLRLPLKVLSKLAAKLGSDVPFFVHNQSFAWVKGRGDKVCLIPGIKNIHPKLWQVVVVPGVCVSTPRIYEQWDILHKTSSNVLTTPRCNVKLISSGVRRTGRNYFKKILWNSLEPATISLYPQVAAIRADLLRCGCDAVLMSGSGPTVFGIVGSRKKAQVLKANIAKLNPACRVFTVCTI